MKSYCVHKIKYVGMGMNGVIEWKIQAGFIYADDMCLMTSSEEDMKVIMEQMNECMVEYVLHSNVVCITVEIGRRRWMMGDCSI